MARVPAGYRRLGGSELNPGSVGQLVSPADQGETITVTVCVRRRPDGPPMPDHDHWLAIPPRKRQFLTREQFAARHGAAQADLDAVIRFARGKGLEVRQASAGGRTVVLSCTVEQASDAFAVRLDRYESKSGSFRSHEGPVHLPSELVGVVVAVFGLNTRTEGRHNANTDPPGAATTTPPAVAQLYNFPPTPPDASGTIIGLIEFSGNLGVGEGPCGWNQSDVTDSLAFFGITAPFTPIDVPVTGTNNPGSRTDPHLADGEVLLDICVAASVAPGATVQVYWGSDVTSPTDWLAVLGAIIASSTHPLPHVLSNSWVLAGGDDSLSTSATQVTALSGKFQDLAAVGVAVFSASGDDGSRCLTTDGKAHVQYPASDPWVTSCGGTAISINPSYVEWIWNDTFTDSSGDTRPYATGGGVSAFFSTIPSWQQLVTVPPSINDGKTMGRGVPDVGGNASVGSGYVLTLYGTPILNFGTSAVGPLYAGLAALLVNRLGARIGFLNPTLYAFRDSVCRDVDDELFPGSPQDNGVPSFPNPSHRRTLSCRQGLSLRARMGRMHRARRHRRRRPAGRLAGRV